LGLDGDPTLVPIYRVVVYSQASQCLFGRVDDPKLSGARSLDDLNRPDVMIAVVKDGPQGRWLRTRLPATKVIEVPGNITTVPNGGDRRGARGRRNDRPVLLRRYISQHPSLASLPFGTSYLDSHELTLPIGLAEPKDKDRLRVAALSAEP
jgi:polar amino acid transport system substrate-binding protein